MHASRIALLSAALVAAGCTVQFGPPKGAPGGPTAFKVTSGEFVGEFKADLGKALAKYGGKVIELTGKVKSAGYDDSGKPRLYLEGPDPAGLEWASCYFDGGYPWARAAPGQTATIKGVGHRAFQNQLTDCEILDVQGSAPTRHNAEQFAKRASDPQAAKKDGPTYFIVSGEVDRYDPGHGVFLKTPPGGPQALLHFSPPEAKRLGVASWKSGQALEVIGMDSTNPGSKRAWLVNCLPLSEPK